jgi:hypothetical protein
MKLLTSEMHGILAAQFVVIGLMAAPLLQAAPEAEGRLVNRISTEVARMQAAVTQLIQSAPEPRAGATETTDPR